ncbi:phage baseplate assembly protein V [Niabella sp. CC-SYL272]|uniref:type VI secretion system Vgr family protein n=1 Tax=Niabella agricola TaxID=2891571 RepID=UPI001F1E6408|nr:phage baseplate assembly protein V [Niabella agricola]MCF3111506.1 phage baseplate assembly protein V [Niabella agricola]
MSNDAILSKTEIIIQGYQNSQPVLFSNLLLDEALVKVNYFSFSMRADDDHATLDAIINFKKSVLGKELQIEFKDSSDASRHRFKGVIEAVNSSLIDEHYYEFQISGSGLFCKINKIPEYHSFYKQTLSDIIDKAYKDSELKSLVKKAPGYTRPLHYTVQYNQTLFDFTTSLALRFGEWAYYDGEYFLFGKKPDGQAIELFAPDDVFNLNIHAHVLRNARAMVGTDSFKGETLRSSKEEAVPENAMLKAAQDAGKKALETRGDDFVASGFDQEMMDHIFRIDQQSSYTASAAITGSTRNNQLAIGRIIQIKDQDDSGGKRFIITQIHHSAMRADHYSNHFTAVPFESEIPPYANAAVFPRAVSQVGIVTDNEDDAGMARVKVKFPWMTDDEKSPWIPLVVPHAGDRKGFRFLPEIEDEVMVHFTDNNAERPYVVGALYTEKHKPQIPEKGNHIKRIGTKTGRRLEMDDEKGEMMLADDFDNDIGNRLYLLKNKEQKLIKLTSGNDDDNFSVVFLDGDKGRATVGVKSGGNVILKIDMQRDGTVMDITSEGTINIKAKQSLNLAADEININATNVSIKADDTLSLKSKMSAELSAADIKVDASASLDLNGSGQAKLAGAMLDLKGDGIASLTGALVKIN